MKVERHYYNPTPEQRAELKARAAQIKRRLEARRARRDKPLKLVQISADIGRFLESADRAAQAGRFSAEPRSGFTLLQGLR